MIVFWHKTGSLSWKPATRKHEKSLAAHKTPVKSESRQHRSVRIAVNVQNRQSDQCLKSVREKESQTSESEMLLAGMAKVLHMFWSFFSWQWCDNRLAGNYMKWNVSTKAGSCFSKYCCVLHPLFLHHQIASYSTYAFYKIHCNFIFSL